MKEEEAAELAEGTAEEGSLHDHMVHWGDVLDRWVRRVDLGMGGRPAGKDEPVERGPDHPQDVEGE
jgi:hypothetical protein